MKNHWEKFVSGWTRFFFEPISPATIGLYRIASGIVIFISVLGKVPGREIFYGENGIVKYESLHRYFPDSIFYFRWMPETDPALLIYFISFLVIIFCYTIGFQSKITSILVFAGLAALSNRNPYVDNNGDNFMRINAFWMMFAHSGHAYSIDRLIARWRGQATQNLVPAAPWGQRLLQLQLAYLYFEAAVTKSGPSWLNGTALYYALNYIEIRRFDFFWAFKHLWQIKVLTYGTMIAELSACSLIWFRSFRYPVVIAAVALHEGINILMQFPVFQYVMMAALVNFIYPEDIEWFFKKVRGLLWRN
jgi:Vitamin K-dependent gamma-carboxylase